MILSILFIVPFLAGIAGLNVVFSSKKINYLLSFSGAFLISTAFVHLIPEVFESESNTFLPSLFILIGFFVQVLLEQLSHGIEHGHFHGNECSHNHNLPFIMFLSLFIHSFLEGGVINHEFFENDNTLLTIALSIAVHKIPVAFALMVLLKTVIKRKLQLYLLLLLFSLSSIFGNFTLEFIHLPHQYVVAFVSGMFLHISTTILFEVSPGHKFELNRFLLALFGGILALLPELL